jgi:hypothetical protein
MSSAITFDVDWAPDWAIALCRDLCRSARVPATFFCTHSCDILEDLRKDSQFEVGIHPNFLTGSSHGSSPSQVMEHVLSLVPEARTMRTHALHQSSRIFAHILDAFPQIESDVSLFLPDHPGLRPTHLHLGANRPLLRLPYWWEDDVAAETPGWDWAGAPKASDGLRIFDFHPVHVALNMANLGSYIRLKETLSGPLTSAAPADFSRCAHAGAGTRTFLERLLAEAERVPFYQVSDLAGAKAKSCE